MESRQVTRAKQRHAAKVAACEAKGFTYPNVVYRPDIGSGKTYQANGAREVARRLKQAAA